MLISVFTAIEPNESPKRTLQSRGPGGLGRGFGGCAHSFTRCPGDEADRIDVGLNASS
jgi:hypothetical protein